MKLADSNIWLALAISKHVFHAAAHAWFLTERQAGGVAFCRSTQQSFLRLITTSAVLRPYGNPPLTNAEAWALYEGFLTDARISLVVAEPPGLERAWRTLAAQGTSSPKLWMDAYLAAFGIAGGHQLVTTDASFQRYDGLDVLVLGEPPAGP